MNDHSIISASPLHPMLLWMFAGLSIWLSTWTVVGVDFYLHCLVYLLSGFSAFMASIASYFAIRHYRVQMALLKEKLKNPEK